jgi:hypothetical protein
VVLFGGLGLVDDSGTLGTRHCDGICVLENSKARLKLRDMERGSRCIQVRRILSSCSGIIFFFADNSRINC